jgi:hypothetical protein
MPAIYVSVQQVSVSACLWISNAREATLTNFTASGGIGAGSASYTASCPERKKTSRQQLNQYYGVLE